MHLVFFFPSAMRQVTRTFGEAIRLRQMNGTLLDVRPSVVFDADFGDCLSYDLPVG